MTKDRMTEREREVKIVEIEGQIGSNQNMGSAGGGRG